MSPEQRRRDLAAHRKMRMCPPTHTHIQLILAIHPKCRWYTKGAYSDVFLSFGNHHFFIYSAAPVKVNPQSLSFKHELYI